KATKRRSALGPAPHHQAGSLLKESGLVAAEPPNQDKETPDETATVSRRANCERITPPARYSDHAGAWPTSLPAGAAGRSRCAHLAGRDAALGTKLCPLAVYLAAGLWTGLLWHGDD